MKDVKISLKRIERATTVEELERLHEYGWKLRRSIEKSRESLDPYFCHSCLRSCHLEDGLINKTSECCHVKALTKDEALERINSILAVAGEKLRGMKGPLEPIRGSRTPRKRGVRFVRMDKGEFKVDIGDVIYSFSDKKRLRKFLRERGNPIGNFELREDGVYHER